MDTADKIMSELEKILIEHSSTEKKTEKMTVNKVGLGLHKLLSENLMPSVHNIRNSASIYEIKYKI